MALAIGFCALCSSAFAATWFVWSDAAGRQHFTHDQPTLGVPYTQVSLPDDIRWYGAPEMPAEIAADSSRTSAPNIFKLASQSVYWISRRSSAGTANAPAVVYGSAVAISEDLALTNCHVIAGAGEDAVIGSANSAERAPAIVVAANIEADRCVVRARNLQLKPVAGLRRFDTLEVGETVYAIGNPRRLELTMSEGLLSGKRVTGDLRLLQMTAPISPGSSGGGLFDSRGNLAGITSSSLVGAQNINFAIPAEDYWN